jgi:hypothetical protein
VAVLVVLCPLTPGEVCDFNLLGDVTLFRPYIPTVDLCLLGEEPPFFNSLALVSYTKSTACWLDKQSQIPSHAIIIKS